MLESIIKAVVTNEKSSMRFENFCNELLSIIEGGAFILNTSQTWDLAKDGRAKLPTGSVFACCSLTDKLDQKMATDIKRLAVFEKNIGTLYFCTSQILSEYRCQILKEEIREILKSETFINILGSNHLSQIAAKNESIPLKYYKAEIEDCKSILKPSAEQSDQDSALRLALFTTGAEESILIRDRLYKGSIIELLVDERWRTARDCCIELSSKLKLSRLIDEDIITTHLNELVDCGQVNKTNKTYQISCEGLKEIEKSNERAASNFILGRNIFREELIKEMGQTISDDHFNKIWTTTKEHLTQAFYTKGKSLVELAASILNGEKLHQTYSSFTTIKDLSIAVANTSTLEQQREELKTAVLDLFTTKENPVFQWFTQICASFVALCSLGLESYSGKALAEAISKIGLVFDTDVLLSLLCDGERDHESVTSIQTRWKILGSPVLIADPVLMETAHHAWIADADFKEVQNWLPGTLDDRTKLVGNAFVRSFATLMSGGKARKNQWDKFISQFKGTDSWDKSKIKQFIKSEYNFEELLQSTSIEDDIEKTAFKLLSEIARKDENGTPHHKEIDKAKRDAKLYASLIRHTKTSRNADPNYICFLVSSSRRLAKLESELNKSEEGQIVITVSMALYLLSLIPNVSIGLSSMSAFLFDERLPAFNSGLERTLVRIIKKSSEIDMPWAKRSTLIQNVRDQAIDLARRSGHRLHTDKEIEEHLLKQENLTTTSTILKRAINESVIDTKTTKENIELKAKISRLEDEVRHLKKKR